MKEATSERSEVKLRAETERVGTAAAGGHEMPEDEKEYCKYISQWQLINQYKDRNNPDWSGPLIEAERWSFLQSFT